MIKEKFIKSLEEGYKNYLLVHARSSSKIIPMHKCLSEILKENLEKILSLNLWVLAIIRNINLKENIILKT